jgi:hypothetical protein
MLDVVVLGVLVLLDGGQKVDRLELMRKDLPSVVQERLGQARLEWTIGRAEKRQSTVFVLLKSNNPTRPEYKMVGVNSAYFEIRPHGSEEEATAGLANLVHSISAPASGKIESIGEECYYWTRQPERGGSVLRLRSGTMVVTIFAPTLDEAKQIAPVVLGALNGEPGGQE